MERRTRRACRRRGVVWFRHKRQVYAKVFKTPQTYSHCLDCGKMVLNGDDRKCWLCGSKDVERVEIESPYQIDFMSTSMGSALIRRAVETSGFSKRKTELRLRQAHLGYLGAHGPMETYYCAPTMIEFSQCGDLVLPLRMVEGTNE